METRRILARRFGTMAALAALALHAAATEPQARRALFGDLHVHSALSFDAYSFGVRATPDDAYRYARGEAIDHTLGYAVQLRAGALDFYAVTDHGVYLGALGALNDPDDPLHGHPLAAEIIARSNPVNPVFEGASIPLAVRSSQRIPGFDAARVMSSAWERTIDAAERHNEPGTFTTFVAYEYTSSPPRSTLHRNVIFAGSQVSPFPFTTVDSPNAENLWRWMDDLRAAGIEALAIPHNSNLSSGLAFERTDWVGRPIDAEYAARRLRNEPLVEVTQIKGSSETHPALSPDDEWAGFEIWAPPGPERAPGSYVRDALRAGLTLEAATGVNPYRFGLIGSSDGHNASSPVDEDRYFGKLGRHDGTPGRRGSVPADPEDTERVGPSFLSWSAAGLAGVWAEENTRPSIYAALRRREAFATSGPRIQVRFFAGYGYGEALADAADAVQRAYADGVPMGGELRLAGGTPDFLVWAGRDPDEAALQRVQVVKGWMADGETHERVFDAVCSDGLAPDPETHRCPDNGATVDLADCSPSDGIGASELRGVWRDPTFSAGETAFYYVRALQNPTCRWSTWDAIRAGVAPAEGAPATIQERAWSSPIWLKP